MKTLFASTAIALSFAVSAFADTHVSSAFVPSIADQALRASDLMGARLYVTEQDIDPMSGASDAWDDVGEVSDVIVGSAGGIDAVLVDIGGFLGLGERTIAVDLDDLAFVSDGADADDYFLVLRSSADALQYAPQFDEVFTRGRTPAPETESTLMIGAAQTSGSGLNSQSLTTTVTPMTIGKELSDAREPIAGDTPEVVEMARDDSEIVITADGEAALADRPMVEREGYDILDAAVMTIDDMTGASVYGVEDEDIGQIGEVLLNESGVPSVAVIDVGGFLGMGEKPVAVPVNRLTFLRADDDIRVYIGATEDQLDAMPAYQD